MFCNKFNRASQMVGAAIRATNASSFKYVPSRISNITSLKQSQASAKVRGSHIWSANVKDTRFAKAAASNNQ